MRPRPYLSYSQMTKFEMSKEKFIAEYLHGERGRISRNMALGSTLADGLMDEEAAGDPILDLVMAKLPKFELMDRPVLDPKGVVVPFERKKKIEYVRIPVLTNGGDDIPLLALPDTSKPDYTAFKEYKSSIRRWTQKMADESGQITFYVTTMWISTGKIPNDIELVNAQTEYAEDGSVHPTGVIFRYKTTRSMADVLKMTKRIRTAWAGIKEVCEKELL